jgi:hypothetical protein
MVSNYKLLSIDNTYNSRGPTTKSYPEATIQSLLYPSLLIYIPLPISPLTTFLLSHDERVCLTCAEQRRVAHSRGGRAVWGWCTAWGGHRRRCGQQLFFSSPMHKQSLSFSLPLHFFLHFFSARTLFMLGSMDMDTCIDI